MAQAKSDLDFARVGLREGFFAHACVHCQQAAEKALKALHDFGGARFVPGHSVVELLAPLTTADPSLAPLRDAARRLDQLYIPTRYPNGWPGGVPAEVFSREQANDAIAQAAAFLERATATIA